MKYTNTKNKKPYTSPRVRVHLVKMEGEMLTGTVTGTGGGQPWGAPKLRGPITNDTHEQQESFEKFSEEKWVF